MGMALIISQVCQLVKHRHLLVNDDMVNIPSYCEGWKKFRTLVQNYLDSCPMKNCQKVEIATPIFIYFYLLTYLSKKYMRIQLFKLIV